MKINQVKTVAVEARTMSLCVKVRDQFACDIMDQDGSRIGQYEGYVPGFFPGDHGGDYVELVINLDTGMIENWRVPTAEQIEKLLKEEN